MRKFILLLLLLTTFYAKNICENKFFTFNTSSYRSSVTILDLIKNLASECKISILAEDAITYRALNQRLKFINISDYSLTDLFDLLLSEHNLFYEYDKNRGLLKISFLKTKTFYIDYVNFQNRKSETKKSIKTGSGSGSSGGKSSGSSSNNEDSLSSVTEFKFWEKIEAEIKALMQRDGDAYRVKSKVFVNSEAGLVTVTGTKRQLDRVVEYINTLLDRLHKQVMIEAKILEVTYRNASSTGIDWSKFDLSLFGNGRGAYSARGVNVISNSLNVPINGFAYDFNMNGFIQFLKQNGDVSIVSNPKVLTLNNQPAVINVGDQINYKYQTGEIVTSTSGTPVGTNTYTIESVFIGVTLSIVPEVTHDGFIILKINPVISDFRDLNQASMKPDTIRSVPPDVKIKQLSSIVKVKNGNRVVIGGLITKTVTDDGNQVPLLGDIPLIGGAFKSHKKGFIKSELVLVITPKIVDGTTNISLEEIDEKFNKRDKKRREK